jgi:hypothetical protein
MANVDTSHTPDIQVDTDQAILTASIKKNSLPATLDLHACIFDRIYAAGCYANLSYFLSHLHPDNIESIQHEGTRQLVNTYKDIAVDVYDDSKHPKAGAIVIPLDKEIIIAFHGINFTRKSDHITNLESTLTHYPYAPGLYHAGFLSISNAMTPKIIHILEMKLGSLHTYPHKIKIYGHSMGAGLAQLLTQYLQHQYENLDIETIVFGSPKVMCPLAALSYNKKNNNRTMRIENPLDLAIYMPAQFMGYGVVNNVILLPKTHSDVMRNHGIEGYLESIDTLRQQFRTQGIPSVSMSDYMAASARFNPVHPWMSSNNSNSISTKSSVSEFMQLMGHGISKGIQSLIRFLPFK